MACTSSVIRARVVAMWRETAHRKGKGKGKVATVAKVIPRCALLATITKALRCPLLDPRPGPGLGCPNRELRRVAKSDNNIRATSNGGVAADMASSLQ